ncbi:FYN-binding protein 1-like [Pseudophryne corroboree]|uniref:FYN-binding protein 1-like n=1 Tax=Pseudophryne corroboree TaxID=495146 RepID=UPI003081D536
MADPEDFKSLRSKFQKDIGDNPRTKPIIPAKPGVKPIVPAKPNLQPITVRCFQNPVPKALSSPDLQVSPKSDPFIAPRKPLLSHQSFSCRSNSGSLHEACINKPSVPTTRPILPRPSLNTPLNKSNGNIYLNLKKPKLKLLPSEVVLGPKPRKPARPPFVDLEKFRKSDDFDDYVTMNSFLVPKDRTQLTTSQSQPNLTTCYPSYGIRNSTGGSQEIYEDVIHFSSIKLSTSLQHFVIKETTGPEDVYDDVETIVEMIEKNKPKIPEQSSPTEQNVLITNWRNETNLKKMQRQEQEFRRKFQFHREIKVLTRVMVDPNAILQKAGYKDLDYIRGEILDVIQLTAADKILCRNCEGKFGYVPRKAVLNLEKKLSSNFNSDEIYDDTELISNTFPAVPAKSRVQSGYVARLFQRNTSQTRKPELPKRDIIKHMKDEGKELKELRKKFKIEGEIKVLTRMMVVPSAGNKRGGGKDLPISKGEILEVIQFTNQEKILCRNSKGKYGYVKRRYVLQLEK